jgi:hypothetical protein
MFQMDGSTEQNKMNAEYVSVFNKTEISFLQADTQTSSVKSDRHMKLTSRKRDLEHCTGRLRRNIRRQVERLL